MKTNLLAILLALLLPTLIFSQKKVIAIAPFEVPKDMQYQYDFNGTGLVDKLPTLLEAELFNTGLFDIVERARLDMFFDEQTLSFAGMTDKEYDFGAWEGVDYFVMGKISGFSTDYDNVRVNVGSRTMYVNNQFVEISLTVKLVDVNTSKVISVITETAEVSSKARPRGNQKTGVDKKNIDEAAKQVVKKIASQIENKMSLK